MVWGYWFLFGRTGGFFCPHPPCLLDMVLVFFFSCFWVDCWRMCAHSFYSHFYCVLGAMGGPCCVLGGSGVLSQGTGSLCVLCG